MVGIKNLVWVGSALRDLKRFPEDVQDEMGFALHKVQSGKVPKHVKPLKGMNPAVMEVVPIMIRRRIVRLIL